VDDNSKYSEFINKGLQKAATQGISACVYVFRNLVEYYEKLKD